MAQKPDGKPNKVERVTFTRSAAERITRVVRSVEAGDRNSPGLTFGRVVSGAFPDGSKHIRAATFTGSWNIGSSKVVTFSNAPTATATVLNIVWPLSNQNPTQQSCLVGKEGTAWMLIVPVLSLISCDDKASSQQLTTFLG